MNPIDIEYIAGAEPVTEDRTTFFDGITNLFNLDGNAEDSIGSNSGTVSGATTVAGNDGDALSFNESDDRVVIPDVEMNDEFTVSFQFKVDDNSGSLFQYMYSHGNINDTNSLNIFLNEDTHGTDPNVLRTVIRDNDDTLDNIALQFDISGIVGDGQWHTYTLTVESGVGSKVFLDGVQQNSDTRGGDSFNPSGDLFLGAREDLNPDRFFGGELDTLQIYNRPLIASEVSDLHNVTAPIIVKDTTVATVSDVVDADDASGHTFALTDDAGGKFQINPTTGEVSFAQDHNASTAYADTVTIEVTDPDLNTYTETIGIAVGSTDSDTQVGLHVQNVMHGLAGNDDLTGGTGGDQMFGGTGNDLLYGGTGNDLLDAGSGNDFTYGGAGNDTIQISSGSGTDTVFGGAGIDTLDARPAGGSFDSVGSFNGIEVIYASDSGNNWNWVSDQITLYGGSGTDSISAGTNNDMVYGGDGADSLSGGAGNDSLAGGDGSDLVYGGDGDDSLTTGIGEDTLYGGAGEDNLANSAGNDTLFGGIGNDTITASLGDDLLYGGAGNDRLFGGEDDDTLYGGAGLDELTGGIGNDALAGDDGNDILVGGSGNDTLTGGSGNDTIVLSASGGDDTVTDFATGDQLDSSALGDVGNILTNQDGTVTADEVTVTGGGGSDQVLTFPSGETITVPDGTIDTSTQATQFSSLVAIGVPPCFAPGTLINTAGGERRVEDLRVGDMVLTADHGFRPLRWIGVRHQEFNDPDTARHKPVEIKTSALGNGLPRRTLVVSPQHRMVLSWPVVEAELGEAEVLAPAKGLLNRDGVRQMKGKRSITYHALLFDRHEIIFAEGAATESFRPGPVALADFDPVARAAVHQIYPGLTDEPEAALGPPARRIVTRKQAEALCRAQGGGGHPRILRNRMATNAL